MQRIINKPELVVDDAIRGYVKAWPQLFTATDNPRVLQYACRTTDSERVGIVTGGGSGHEPAFLGYIGKNMLDAVAIGEVFSSPTAISFLDSMRAADNGAGVACLYGNYAGDNMNVAMAVQMAEAEGISVKTVVANDDVASAPATEKDKRRGVAGEILMWKIAGAAAASGYNLDNVIRVAQLAIDNTRSIGMGLTSCVIPAVGKPNFTIRPGTMEIGIGHHGEPGTEVRDITDASRIAQLMVNSVLDDLPFQTNDDVAVLISGLGATPQMELHILYSAVAELLESSGLTIHRAFVGNYFTSLDMMGATLTVMRLNFELKGLLDMPAESLALTLREET
ncbi:dihydroxyacetone kinase subunit DhaK [Aliamphritea hakodatensis]|uniref:dihydroxyacetone kinase subunit DhaK n=1 Tax=Aliamphritea hakodatensis TaxID=2895352 RepID=UPI0022FDAC38|nr:dihydroxyacetone kinase subunit DhaK [Aliamphritea hakodatensis]